MALEISLSKSLLKILSMLVALEISLTKMLFIDVSASLALEVSTRVISIVADVIPLRFVRLILNCEELNRFVNIGYGSDILYDNKIFYFY
jgi:hypothetical protein